MNYSQQYEYLTFLAERTTQQVRMERIINEAVLIGEGADTIENIELIQESFSESVKKVIHKLLTFIGKLWGKFIEAMNTLIKNDKAYLERYKDIILKKKPADDIIIYDYYNGGIQLLLNNSCPQLTDQDINAEEGKSVLDDKNTFITQRFRDFTKFCKGPFDSITDLATAAFRGGGDEVSKVASNVNMTDMYNYCINYGSLKDKIQRDINAFQEAQKKFDSKLASMNNNNELKQQQQESALSIFEDRKYYSAIFEQYITEADDKDKNNEPPIDNNNAMEQAAKEGKKEQEQQDKANAAKQQQQNQNNNNNNNVTVNNGNTAANYQQNTKDNADANVEQNKNTYNTLQERAKVYFEIGGQYFAAKLTVAQEAEKKFMEVIENHVRHYVGTNDKDDDQAAKGNTNLNLPNNNNNNQQQNTNNATPDNDNGNTNNQDQNCNK